MLSVRLHPALQKRLDELVARTHRSKSSCVQQALEEFLEDQEDYLDALTVVERIKRGEEKVHSYEEVIKALGLENAHLDS